MTDGPEPTEFDLGCFFHGYEGEWNIDSEVKPHTVCFECGHIYWTGEQLLKEFNEDIENSAKVFNLPDVPLAVSVDEIFFCAWCGHDF